MMKDQRSEEMMNDGQTEIYTLGHSNRNIEEFLEILKKKDIDIVIDVRLIPGSNKYPQYNKENLEKYLNNNNIEYLHLKELGGFRKPLKDSKNIWWRNKSFRGFADYIQRTEFKDVIKKLMEITKNKKVVIICSEKNPYRCHIRIISDYLSLIYNVKVIHIIDKNREEEHKVTKSTKIINNDIIYQ